MTTVRGSFPHPVLDHTDDVDATFKLTNTTYTPSVDDVRLDFRVIMDDPDLKALIDANQARYSFRWSCSSTMAAGELEPRAVDLRADSTRYQAWILQENLRGRVRVETRIIATRRIPYYRLGNQHPDYGDATFSILPGDILAEAGVFEFEPDKLYDPLNPPLHSCFKFEKAPLARTIHVSFRDDEAVYVTFPAELYDGFAALGNRPDLQISLVVLPALMQTISFIRDNQQPAGEDLSDMRWVTVISELVTNVGSFDEPIFDLAQKILAKPLDRVLIAALSVEEEDE